MTNLEQKMRDAAIPYRGFYAGTFVPLDTAVSILAEAQESRWQPIKEIILVLEAALQLSASIPCVCDRTKADVCSGTCLGSRVWQEEYRARRLLKRLLPTPPEPSEVK